MGVETSRRRNLVSHGKVAIHPAQLLWRNYCGATTAAQLLRFVSHAVHGHDGIDAVRAKLRTDPAYVRVDRPLGD